MTCTLVNLNMWEGGNLMDNILEFFRMQKPDILVLQEVYNGHDTTWERKYRTMDVLQEAFPELKYSHFAPAFLDQMDFGAVEQGNAVLSCFPIVESRTTFGDMPYCTRLSGSKIERTPRNLQEVVLDVNGTKLTVFNTQGIWGTDGADNERRLALSDTIVSQIAHKDPVVLCGDFNVRMDTESIAKIEKHLANVFKDKLVTSFNLRHKKQPCFATAVVDAIFVSQTVRVLSQEVSCADVSDHLPFIIKLH